LSPKSSIERGAAEFGGKEMSPSVPTGEPVRNLLDAFDRLAEPDRREFVLEILRRTREMDWPPIDDETIARIAEEAFLEYDAREVDQANPVETPDRPGQFVDEMNDHE
jgi:hypothetical protein